MVGRAVHTIVAKKQRKGVYRKMLVQDIAQGHTPSDLLLPISPISYLSHCHNHHHHHIMNPSRD
jgi:hypothetical protein